MSTQNSPESILIQAVACHTAGAFQDAERLYLAVLQTDPMHPVANHNLGAIAVQQSRPAEGLPYFLAALEADPASSRYWTSYIDALFQSGQVEEAGQMLSLAQQQGLQGAEVDALMLRINGPEQAATGDRPDAAEIDALVALFNGGHLVEATGIARKMTGRYPQHEFGWKALGAIYKQSGQDEAALVPMQKAAALSPGDVEAHYNLGVTLQALGRLVDAEAAYRHALSINPDYADAHCNLGVTLQKLGRFDDAYACYRRALQINPDFVAAHYNLGGVLRELGRTDEAQVSYRKVLELKPDYAEAHYNLGNILLDLSRLADAEACFREALRYKADYADAYFNLGKTLKEQGRLKESQASYIQSLQLCPDNAQAHYNLANVYKDMAQMDEAQSAYLQTIRIAPDMFEAHYNLGNLYLDMGRLVDAEACYRQAIRINPNLADAHYNLGNTLKEMGRVEEAATSFRRTLALRPDYAEAWCNLGNISLGVGRLFEAESIFRRAIQIKPDLSEAHCNLGNTLMALGCLDESHESYRRALQIKPDFSQAHSNLIFTLDLTAGCDSSLLHEERRLWAALHASHLHQQLMHPNLKDPLRRLRIGYVSADFRVHSAAYAFGAMLTRFDPANFDVIAYSNSTVEDELTRTFQRSVTAWRNIARLSDDEVSALIRSDDIDILVDLSGHSAGNRLLTFARKPAPVQITAWGYATGTGMAAMDVFFADPVFVPPHERHLYAEQVRYLPCALGFFFSEALPEVNALPALSNGEITFGSFNRLVKNSDEAYRVWAKILQALPDSKMVFKTPALDDADTRDRVRAYFTREGIDPARIILLGRTNRDEHMAAFNLIDIALDPFPQGGGVSALEGLMMGVPVITLHGATLAGRVSASVVTTLGLVDWIADTEEEYVRIAIQKAKDLRALSELRQQLRGIFTSSVIGDQAAYVRAVEREYRLLWQQWCESDARSGQDA